MKILRLGLISICVLAFCAYSAAQGLVSVEEDGHKVFVNADGPAAGTKLAYWSTTEHRWKQVPARNSVTMKQAQSAIADVQREMSPQKSGAAAPQSISQAHLDALIDEAAARHQVDPNLVRAVIKVESNFDPNAVSRKGAIGLMQLMPSTARQLNVSDPYDPQQNVDAGVRHLKSLLDNYGGDVPRSLAAYNAGEKAVARSGGIPPYAETRNYVKQITHLYSSSSGTRSWKPITKPVRIAHEGDGPATLTNVY
ncbi:MAG TPA: lytic transglycosylase domain-containing protein [Terriglobales bacterium]|nr:lytic transglycosylase domain-containing protein [Terriglobales bacterium]